MERSTQDSVQNRGSRHGGLPDTSFAAASAPASMSGAHWANRDSDHQYRRNAGGMPFRRPPADNSVPGRSAVSPSIPVSPAVVPMTVGDRAPRSEVAAMPAGVAPHTSGAAGIVSPHTPGAPGMASGDGDDVVKARHWTADGEAARHRSPTDGPQTTTPGTPVGGFTVPAEPWVQSAEHAGTRGVEALFGTATSGTPDGGAAVGGVTDSSEVGNLFSGPGREIRPHRARRRDADTDPRRGAMPPIPARQRPGSGRWAIFATVLVVAGGALTAGYFAGGWDRLSSLVGGSSSDDRTVTAPLDGRVVANFELVTGTTTATMRSADLGDKLFQVTTADDSGILPRVAVDDKRVQLHFDPSGGVGFTGEVEIVLSTKVRWALLLSGGADEQRIDLSDGQVSSVDMTGGARQIELNLPAARGTVPVRLYGAVEEVAIKAPKSSPVRLQLDSGAQTVAAGERTRRDVEPGAEFTPRGWQDKNDRYDVNAAAHVTLLSLTTSTR